MTYTLITVSSVTYAMKAKTVLNNSGRYCEIERQDKNTRTGCGYVIRVRDDPELICSILSKNGIAAKDKKTVVR